MNLGNAVLIGGVAYLLISGYQKAQFAQTVQVLFSGVTVHNLNSITVRFTIQNITGATIVVKSLTGYLYLNGNEVATLSKFDETEIAPNSETVMSINVSPDLLSIVDNFSSLISTGSTLNFLASGNMNLEGLPILPFELEKTITL